MKIAEVSQNHGISIDTLRYYERIGLLPSVSRNSSGIREYTEDDCSWVSFIKLMRSAGVSIEALIQYVALAQQGDETIELRREILIEQRKLLVERMAEMQKTLERLNYKIERYDSMMVPVTDELVKGSQVLQEA